MQYKLPQGAAPRDISNPISLEDPVPKDPEELTAGPFVAVRRYLGTRAVSREFTITQHPRLATAEADR